MKTRSDRRLNCAALIRVEPFDIPHFVDHVPSLRDIGLMMGKH